MSRVLRLWCSIALVLGTGVMSPLAAASQQPAPVVEETLVDAALEARVQTLSGTIRCVVCKNQSIAESDAGLAQDLVRVVRDRVAAGDSDAQVQAYLVERYGEFILLKPRFSWRNGVLWGAPAIVFLLGGMAAFGFVRQRGGASTAPVALTDEEREELDRRLSG